MMMRRPFPRTVVLGLFAFYLYVLVKVILLKFHPLDTLYLKDRLARMAAYPGGIAERLREGNLTPFAEISRDLHTMTGPSFFNLIGNIAIFAPFGIFLGLWSTGPRKLSFAGALALSFGLSFCLESAQLVLSLGMFDVDDLILNSAGGLFGYAVFRLIAAITGILTGIVRSAGRPTHGAGADDGETFPHAQPK